MSSSKTLSGTGFSNQQKVVQHLVHLESLQPTKAKPFEHQIESLLESEMNVHEFPQCVNSSPSISPPVSPLRYGMVGTVAGDGAPRPLSAVRSSGVCWTRPFSFSDSSLVGLRPFLLLLFHPARALCALFFVALRCLLRYCLGFYLN